MNSYGIYFLALVLLASDVVAKPLGRAREGIVRTLHGKPALCLPVNAEVDFPVAGLSVSEAGTNPGVYFSTDLKSSGVPIVLQPTECIVLGRSISSYNVSGGLAVERMRFGYIYTGRVNRVRDNKNPNTFYTFAFCVSRSPEGGFEYINYGSTATDEEQKHCDALTVRIMGK